MEKYGLTQKIHLVTAQRWMHRLGYRWSKTLDGQYIDGHKRDDMVTYQQQIFLPAWMALEG
jgi:hypothetical protein